MLLFYIENLSASSLLLYALTTSRPLRFIRFFSNCVVLLRSVVNLHALLQQNSEVDKLRKIIVDVVRKQNRQEYEETEDRQQRI